MADRNDQVLGIDEGHGDDPAVQVEEDEVSEPVSRLPERPPPPGAEHLIVYGSDPEDDPPASFRAFSALTAAESHFSTKRKAAESRAQALDRDEFASPEQRHKRRRAEDEEEGDEANKPEEPPPPERLCPCGAGPCTVFTSNTERNPGRKFYRCPLGKEQGCSFFEWCDGKGLNGGAAGAGGVAAPPMGRSPVIGAGGQQTPGAPNPSLADRIASSTCYKCGQVGHWASHCPNKGAPGSAGKGRGDGGGPGNAGAKGGACFICGQAGHWASSCPNKFRR